MPQTVTEPVALNDILDMYRACRRPQTNHMNALPNPSRLRERPQPLETWCEYAREFDGDSPVLCELAASAQGVDLSEIPLPALTRPETQQAVGCQVVGLAMAGDIPVQVAVRRNPHYPAQ
jgi:hypothetical protein